MKLIFIGILLFLFSSIAFYVAVETYRSDEHTKQVIAKEVGLLQEIALKNSVNMNTQRTIDDKNIQLDELITKCNNVISRINSDRLTMETAANMTFDVFNTINTTIFNENTTCKNEIERLTITLEQLVNTTNEPASLVYSGTCQFNSLLVNDTVVVNYDYKLLQLNGLEFYYYEFLNSTGIIEASLGVKFENCSPRIFKGIQIPKIFVADQLTGFVGSPFSMVDYVSYAVIGNEYLQFIPKIIPTVNQTLFLNNTFQIWVNLF